MLSSDTVTNSYGTTENSCIESNDTTVTVDQSAKSTGSSVAAASGGAAILSSLSNLSSPQGLYMSMNQFQLILLTLLTNAYIPKKVVDYLAGMKSTTCSFGFIPFKKIPGFTSLIDWFYFKRTYYKLDYFGIESGSTFVDTFSLMCIFAIIVIIHSLIAVLYAFCRKNSESKSGK